MTTEAPLPPTGRGSAFTTGEGLRAGLSAREVFGSSYARPHHGIRTLEDPLTPEEMATAYLPRMRAWQAFGDTTAAIFWGLPLPNRLLASMTVHIVVPTGRNAPKGNRLAARRISPDKWERIEHRGVPLASPALTWGLLSRVLSTQELITVGDALVSTSRNYRSLRRPYDPSIPENEYTGVPPLATLEQLGETSNRWGRTIGASRLRLALPQIREGVESPRETATRLALIDAGFPEPVVAHEVFQRGRFLGRVDLAYPELRIAIEYDGKHHWTEQQALKDIARINRIQQAGWLVIRVTRQQLSNPAEFFAQVRAAMSRA
ncbi:MAG: endonuclease domain-containing protein [Pseudoclavibacter sp.]